MGKLEALLTQLQRRLVFRSGQIKYPQVPQNREESGGLAELLAEGAGARVGLDHIRGRVALGRQQGRSQSG